jgi:hypothetical protein
MDSKRTDKQRRSSLTDDGNYGAVDGNHDDRVMSRLIGLHVCYDFKYYALPALKTLNKNKLPTKKLLTTSDF